MPSATPTELAAAILDSIRAGARVLKLSVVLVHPSSTGQREFEEALDYAARRGAIAVAAAGNQGAVRSSAIPGSFQWLLMTCEADPSNSRTWEVQPEDVGWVRPAMT